MYKIVNKKKKAAVEALDPLGRVVFHLFNTPRGQKGDIVREKVRKLLLVRLAYLGDIILTLPVLKPLRMRFPQARISFLTSSQAKELLEGNPFIDEIIAYDAFWFYGKVNWHRLRDYVRLIKLLRRKRFDLAIDFRGDFRNIALLVYPSRAPHRVSYGITGGDYLLTKVIPFKGVKHKVDFHLGILQAMGIDVSEPEFTIPIRPEEMQYVENLLLNLNIKKGDLVIAIHPGGRLPLKRWLPERFAEVADSLVQNHQSRVLVIGSADEEIIVNEVISRMENRADTLAGNLGLRQLAYLLQRCDLVVCNDSACLHLAAAMGTPVVAIFGPSDSRETGPWGESHRVVEREMSCRPSCDEHSCRNNRYQDCMQGISVSDVTSSVDEVLRLRCLPRKVS